MATLETRTPASNGPDLPPRRRLIQRERSVKRNWSSVGIPRKFQALAASDRAVETASAVVVDAMKKAAELQGTCARAGEVHVLFAEARVQIERSLKPEEARPHLEKLDTAEAKFNKGLGDVCVVIRKEERA